MATVAAETSAATPSTRTAPLLRYTLDELRTLNFPEPEWVVDGLLPAGALVLLVGRPKAGKSLLVIDLLAAVARGEPFLGRATRQGPALYVPAEDAIPLVRERLDARVGPIAEVPITVAPADGSVRQQVRLDQPAPLTQLVAAVRDDCPRVLVLDPLREFHHLQENDADQMALLLRPLRRLAHASKTLVVLVHHRNKHAADPILASRGSSAITGSVDIIVTVETTANRNGIELDLDGDDRQDQEQDTERLATGAGQAHVLKILIEGRYGPRRTLAVRLAKGLRWEPVDAPAARVTTRPVRQRILSLLADDARGYTAEEIAGELGLRTPVVRNELTHLSKARHVLREGPGKRSDPYRYRALDAAGRETDRPTGADDSSSLETGVNG